MRITCNNFLCEFTEESLFGAAKEVATSLGGDVQKTESDLLNKLLSSDTKKSEVSLDDPKTPLSLRLVAKICKSFRTLGIF